jgi:hypothetical protein
MLGRKTLISYLQIILTVIIVSLIIIFSIHAFLSLVAAYTDPKDIDIIIYISSLHHNNILPIEDNNMLGNLAKQFGGLTKQFEYTVDLDGRQIFPNDTIKENIITNYKSENYNISSLNYKLLGFNISASNIKIHVNPSRIDQTMTRIDFPILIARNISVTNGLVNLKYSEVNLGSIYGIYNKNNDKMTMHIPISIALQYLPHV